MKPLLHCWRRPAARLAGSFAVIASQQQSHEPGGSAPRYERVADLDAALRRLAEGGWTLLAGGTDFYPARVGRPVRESLLDLSALEALRGVRAVGDGAAAAWHIGALTTWSELARAPLAPALCALRQVALEVGGVQIQNRATIGGNLCNASPAADGVPVLLALDARVELASVRGRRVLPLQEFVLGNRRTALAPDEMLTALIVPGRSPRALSRFLKLGHRRHLVISAATVAVAVDFDTAGCVTSCAAAVGACSAVPVRLPVLEAAMVGVPCERLVAVFDARCAPDAFAPLAPIDDIRGTAAWRGAAAIEMLRRLFAELAAAGASAASPGAASRSAAGDVSGHASGDRGAPATARADRPGSRAATRDTRAPEPAIRVDVNGRAVVLHAAPATRLSDCLRDELGLTGTKIGCHAGDCGACTVLLDGEQVCACLVPVGQCGGRAITTVESLAAAAAGSPQAALRQAFIDHGAAQCGICTPGMLMAGLDVLRRHPQPTEGQVLDGLGGVLCRCTGYRKIVEAVLAASGVAPGAARREADAPGAVTPVAVAAPSPGAGRAVGARLPRVDAADKVDGRLVYGADRAPADACWLKVVRSPHASAQFEYGDLDAFVAAHPGLLGVLTAADIPNNRFAIFPDLRDQPAIAERRVRLRGEAVLVLAGERDALDAIDADAVPIRWQPLEALRDPAAALASSAPALHERWPDNVLCRGRVVRGDVDAALAAAPVSVSAAMRTAHIEHAYIEPEAGYAQWSSAGRVERVTVFACTQTPYMDRDELAWMFGLRPEQVRIVPSGIGGGFGGKLDISIQPLLVAAARKFGRAARIVYTRPESMASTTKRHPAQMRATLAADHAGRLLAADFHGDFDTGAYSSWGPTVANRVPIHASGPYRVAAVRALTRAVHTNNPISGAFRGFGVPQSTLLNETLVDMLAQRLGADPLEYRFAQALRAGDLTPTGQRLTASVGLRACLDALRPQWREMRARAEAFNVARAQADDREGAGAIAAAASSDPHRRYAVHKRRGVGIACMWYGIGNTVIANPSSMQVGLRRDGRFMLYNGAVDIGQGSSTVIAQICADALGVPVELVDQCGADTDLTLDAGKSSASRQTFVSGNAAKAAGTDLRARLLALLGLPAHAALALDGPRLAGAAGAQRATLDLGAMPADARGDVALGSGHFDPPTVPLDADGQGVPYATYGFAAQFAEVEVDLAFGSVRVLSIHAAHDVGRAINPTQVEGQIHGGIAQGLGLALMEEYRAGHTDNLHDYLIPGAGDVPPIVVHLVEDAEPLGPYGAKGVGEPALVATAPAILNAIHHATGVRMGQVPVTPDRLCAALRHGAPR